MQSQVCPGLNLTHFGPGTIVPQEMQHRLLQDQSGPIIGVEAAAACKRTADSLHEKPPQRVLDVSPIMVALRERFRDPRLLERRLTQPLSQVDPRLSWTPGLVCDWTGWPAGWVYLEANQHTLRAYRADLLRFARSFPRLDTSDLAADHLRAFLQEMSKRMVKKQQIRWTRRGAGNVRQIRTGGLDGEFRQTIARRYPGMQPSEPEVARAA